tara:strand:+ start:125 stop:340 length:216 start_codon:yes stop_codon:yes gene_type:complete
MSNKNKNTENKSLMPYIAGSLAIAGTVMFPAAAAGLLLFALVGKDSCRASYWRGIDSDFGTRGPNYDDPRK